MTGSTILIEPFSGGYAAALLRKGVLEDLFIDAPDDRPTPGAIYRVKVGKPVKGLGGTMLDIGGGQTGFLREAKGLVPGQMLLAQSGTYAEPGKAVPMTSRLMFKSRYAIVTPGAPGINPARSIRDAEERERLSSIGNTAMTGSDFGLILRSASEGIEADELDGDIRQMRELAEQVMDDSGIKPGLLMDAPDARFLAWREWDTDEVIEEEDAFDRLGLWERIEQLKHPHEPLPGGGSMLIEPTAALVAVDVNTGGDFSPQTGLKANRQAAEALPRALRLRGLGGQVVIDFAPMPKGERRGIEAALRSSLKRDLVETTLVGWTPLGHFELQRKRDRRPIVEILQ